MPNFRHQLYVKVLNRMLTGRWRHDDDSQPDRETCIGILRRWAWSGATSDPRSGIANWPDEIPTRVSREHPDDQAALDHVAVPTSRADVDTGPVPRRFVHRTLREQLVAEQVADLSTEEAARVLLPHLWFDVDWEYTGSDPADRATLIGARSGSRSVQKKGVTCAPGCSVSLGRCHGTAR